MFVMKNPNHKLGLRPLVVLHPVTGKPFPDGVFDLPPADLKIPGILRLLPPPPMGVAGGVMGDLVLVDDPDEKHPGKSSARPGDDQIIKDIQNLMPTLNKSDFTKAGPPKEKVVSQKLGYDVTEAECGYAFENSSAA